MEQIGYYLGEWLFMQCRLLPTPTQEWEENDNDAELHFFIPEQNRALLTAGVNPYGLKRLDIAIGADAEPDYIDQLPEPSRQTTAAVHAVLRQAIPEQTHIIRQQLAQILLAELGITDTER